MIARLKRAAAAAAISAAVAAVGPAAAQQAERSELTVETAAGPRIFQVEIADTPEARSTGLMYRRDLDPEHGMLFDFGDERPVSMWMRNTYVSLDMLFIGSDRRIKNIARRTTPLSERTLESAGPVRYVLEINGGLSEELGIAAGDVVSGPAIED
ncbi:MAG TPA: DUF192 domain-containing protein [Afifellaceae bacterium]|nr:DUF192 domain-containing protein [Afifellaceae bacterium]